MSKVIGLVFAHKARALRHPRYIGVEAWVAAKRPSPAFVYDHAGVLVDAGIPIGDALFRGGVYHKLPCISHEFVNTQVFPPTPAAKSAKPFSARGGYEFPGEVVVVEPEASKKAAGDGSKMSRGVNKRTADKGSK